MLPAAAAHDVPGMLKLGLPIDPQSRHAVKRFGLKLGLLVLFAVAQLGTPWGPVKALQIMASGSAAMSAGLAILFRQQLRGQMFSYWDEALIFSTLALFLRVW